MKSGTRKGDARKKSERCKGNARKKSERRDVGKGNDCRKRPEYVEKRRKFKRWNAKGPRVQFLLSMFNIEHDTCSTLEVGQGKCSKYEHASCSTMLDMTHVQQLFKLNMHPVQLD